MFDPMSMVEGAGLLLAGGSFGRILSNRRRRGPKPVQPICGCGHHYAHHGETGKCHHVEVLTEEREVPIKDEKGAPLRGERGLPRTECNTVVFARIPCTCQRYVGPDPLPSVVAL